MHRRDVLRAGVAAMAIPVPPGLGASAPRAVRSFRLVEPAGLRRFGYPVRAVVPDAGDGRNFRLLRDGRAIPAQFRAVDRPGGPPEILLDFVASPGPLESDRYEVLFGPDVEPGPTFDSGLKVERRGPGLLVHQGGGLTFEFAENVAQFLKGLGSPRLGYLREGSPGLSILERNAPSYAPIDEGKAPGRMMVTREGPFAVGLRSEWSGPGDVRSRLELTIPHSKSWVQARWSLDDPGNRVAGLKVELNLRIEGPPTLVDLGAGSTIYGKLEGTQRAEMVAGNAVGGARPGARPNWVVRLGTGETPPVLASSTGDSPREAEGWAHVMDARRCTALAVADFGRERVRDAISASGGGRLALTREFAPGGPGAGAGEGTKSLAFWLHFVPMPVQVGAATSPQAILSPLRVEWDRPPA